MRILSPPMLSPRASSLAQLRERVPQGRPDGPCRILHAVGRPADRDYTDQSSRTIEHRRGNRGRSRGIDGERITALADPFELCLEVLVAPRDSPLRECEEDPAGGALCDGEGLPEMRDESNLVRALGLLDCHDLP